MKPPPAEWAGKYDGPEIWEHVLARKPTQYLVGEVKGCNLSMADGGTAAAPIVAGAGPIELVGCQRVLAIAAVVGGKAATQDCRQRIETM